MTSRHKQNASARESPMNESTRVFEDLASVLTQYAVKTPPRFSIPEIDCKTVRVAMRDDVQLATDVYRPRGNQLPTVLIRSPYGRAPDSLVGYFFTLARRGFVVVSQDCRGTGESEPDTFNYYMFEEEDGFDLVEWVIQQGWYDGFIGALGGSYVGQTQWCMAMHPRMSTIAPRVSGLGLARNTAGLYMYCNASARAVGKGGGETAVDRHDMERLIANETTAGGYFNEPMSVSFSPTLYRRFPNLANLNTEQAAKWLWQSYCSLTGAQRTEFVKDALGVPNVRVVDLFRLCSILGLGMNADALTVPSTNGADLCRRLRAPPLMITGWYDWCLNDALVTWEEIQNSAEPRVRENSRLILTPAAHAAPGFHENIARNPELVNSHRTHPELLMRWYEAVREGSVDAWPKVIYYLMGANAWHSATAWPVPEATPGMFYLQAGGKLTVQRPDQRSEPDEFLYDPHDPTPTVGGSIVSHVYPPGSVDVSEVQKRSDILLYTTEVLEEDLDVVGPLRLILFASSSAKDTDFVARLSDVYPDGRAIQIQSGILRARYRDLAGGGPASLESGEIYRLEIDLWATANRFKGGHRLRVDISSADFPHYERNSNLGGEPGIAVLARQCIYHDSERPSHLLVYVLKPRS